MVPLRSRCFHQVQPGVRSCPNRQSIILPFSQAATVAAAAGISYCELGPLLPACCAGGRERQRVQWGLFKWRSKHCASKQYRASQCVHKMNRLDFTVARRTEGKICSMKAAPRQKKVLRRSESGKTTAACVSLQHADGGRSHSERSGFH